METGELMDEPTESIAEAQDEIVEEFEFFDDWMERYQHIIDLGRKLPEFPAEYQTDDYKVRGCQSQVWLKATPEDGRLRLQAISDAAIVSGLIALLLRVYDNRTPEEIVETEPRFIESIGLEEHLSPTRANGLHAMLKAIKGHAATKLQEAG
jgi:cysteine desulfuration protein SufE